MDKYEYKVKTEQMLGYVERKQYQKAMEIADTIDWRRVKSASMLSSVSEIYEYNGENGKSRDILLVAFDRSPGSRKIIYRLGTLALKLNDIEEASDCYEEFVKLAPRDPNQYILKYKILKAQEAPLTDQISALEDFKKAEYIEKWAYELAKLYHEAGMTSECLEECDDLILWFSEGKYVYKAMELKMKYKPLTPLQQQKYDNRPGAPKKAPVQEPPKEIPKAKTSPLSQIEKTEAPKAANLREVISEVEKDETISMTPPTAPIVAHEKEERHSAITNVVTGSSLQEAVRAGMAIASGINIEEKAMKEKDEELRVNGQMMIDEILQEWEEKQKENAEAIEKQKEEDHERLSKERADAERRLEEERLEVERKAAEAEEARKLAEEEARKAAEEEAAKKAAEEEAARKAAEEEAAKKAAEEAAARKVAEEEAAKKAAEEEAARKAAEEEAAKKAAEEEAAKKAAEEEAARKAAEEEAAKKAEEEEARRIASEEIANLALEAGVLSEEEIKEKFPKEEPQEISEEELHQLMAELDEEPESKEEIEAEKIASDETEERKVSLEATKIISVDDKLLADLNSEEDWEEEDFEEEDLQEEDLEEVDFEEKDLQEEDLEEVDFEEKDLQEEDLEEVDFEEKDLQEEDLEEVDFEEKDLQEEDLEEVDFEEKDLQEEDFDEADFEEEDFEEEELQEADFDDEDFEEEAEETIMEDFREIELEEEEPALEVEDYKEDIEEEGLHNDLEEVEEEDFGEDFEEELQEEDFEEADFGEEDFQEEDFEDADFEEDFQEEDLEDADLEEESPEAEILKEEIPETDFEVEEESEDKDVEIPDLENEIEEIDEFREFEDIGFDDDFEDDFDADFEDDFEDDDFEEDELEEKDFEEGDLETEEPEEEEKISLEDLEIEEPSEEEIQERIKKSKGSGVPFDTGFVVTGRYDLSATSEIGLKAGLTEDQKKLFSYFVPVRGMSEQLVTVLDNDRRAQREGTSKTGNLIIAGRKGSGKTVLAVDIVKAIQKQRNLKQGKVAIVTGDSLNKKELTNIIQKLRGGAIIIEKAGKLNSRTIKELNYLMEKKTGELLFVLEDQRKPLERIMTAHPDFRKKFTSKLELPVFINDELVTFGQTYAKENGYKLDEMGILALYSRIDVMQREDHSVSVAEVKDIMDEAIEHSQKATAKHLARRVFGKGTDDSDRIILKEEDFKI